MTVVHKLQPALCRVVALRQVDTTSWQVDAYERTPHGWQFTWRLSLPTTKSHAIRTARDLARAMGLPVVMQPRGERLALVSGMLGHTVEGRRA